MKRPLVLSLVVFAGACTPDDTVTPVEIPFSAVVGDAPFSCEASFPVGTSEASVRPVDLRFYLHGLEVLSGGQRLPVTLDDGDFQGNGIALLDLEDGTGDCATGSSATHATLTGEVGGTIDAIDGIAFTLGVPEEQNHLDAATAPAPLNVPAMWWSWVGGYKFMKVDVKTPSNPEFFFHAGATDCAGDPTAGFSCAFGNTATVEVDGAGVVVDLAALYTGVDVDAAPAQGDSVPGCMSFPGDPECPAMYGALGLAFESDEPLGTSQTLFRGAP